MASEIIKYVSQARGQELLEFIMMAGNGYVDGLLVKNNQALLVVAKNVITPILYLLGINDPMNVIKATAKGSAYFWGLIFGL